jgi:hypothetical protein
MGCYTFIAYLFSRESQNGLVHNTVCKSQVGYLYRVIIDTSASTEWLPLKITASQNFVVLYVSVRL